MIEQKYRIRMCLLYDFKQGKNAKESHSILCKVFHDDVPTLRQCQRWYQRFREGDESLEDMEHGKRPEVVDNEELKAAIELDPTQTGRQLAERFGCHYSTITLHLHAIGKNNRCGKWVLHQLSDTNKAARVTIAGILLRRAKNTGFFESILTSDEKWISYNNTTKKRQWLSPRQPPKTTPKPDFHGKKNLLCVWWNTKGLVYFEVLESGQTVNSDLYSQQLSRVNQALMRQNIDTRMIKFLHDNARPHVSKITLERIEELDWEVLPHPPYSPDIAPSDYHLFRSMEHLLREKIFQNLDEINNWVANFFKSQPAEFFEKGIHSLRGRWRQIIDTGGEYLLD